MSPPARAEGPNPARERFRIVGKVLGDFRGDIETDHEGFVITGPDRLVEKLNRRFLLELETVADGVAGIDQQPDLQRQIGFIVKAANLVGRFAVIDDREIALRQVPYIAAMLVGDGEHDVHFVHRLGDRGGGVIVGVRGLVSVGLRGSIRLRCFRLRGRRIGRRIGLQTGRLGRIRCWRRCTRWRRSRGRRLGLAAFLFDRRGRGGQFVRGILGQQHCHEPHAAQQQYDSAELHDASIIAFDGVGRTLLSDFAQGRLCPTPLILALILEVPSQG